MRPPIRLEAGVDWITSTARIGTEQSDRILHYGATLAQRRGKEGIYAQATRILGFDGFSIGKDIFYGQARTFSMLRVTGERADSAYREVHRPNDHYTRLDIQSTVWLPELHKAYPDNLYRIFMRQYDAETEKGSVPRALRDGKGGWTIYSAARTAKQMARVYNKYAETPETTYEGAIRYELELKDAYATDMATMLGYQGDFMEKYILSYLKLWFKRKGIILPYTIRDAHISLLSVPHGKTDTERQLLWLQRQVKPTVKKLIDLGLRDYVTMLLFGSNSATDENDTHLQ
jgi:hypothetical protein